MAQAICLNQETQLSQAMAVAPRAERAQHLLVVSAGEMRLGQIFQLTSGVKSTEHEEVLLDALDTSFDVFFF